MKTKQQAGNRAKQKKTRQRRRIVEGLYLDGYGAQEIHDRLPDKYKVCYGTVRIDITVVRKAWAADIDASDEFEGRHRYLASTRGLRRKADDAGKLELVHVLDKEIARLSGVSLKGDIKQVNLTVDRARDYIDEVMAVVFDVVEDEYIQDRIIAGLAELDGNH